MDIYEFTWLLDFQPPPIIRDPMTTNVQTLPLILKSDGSVDQRRSALRDASIVLKSDGSVDRRCNAVRSGMLIVKADGNPDPKSKIFL